MGKGDGFEKAGVWRIAGGAYRHGSKEGREDLMNEWMNEGKIEWGKYRMDVIQSVDTSFVNWTIWKYTNIAYNSILY